MLFLIVINLKSMQMLNKCKFIIILIHEFKKNFIKNFHKDININ